MAEGDYLRTVLAAGLCPKCKKPKHSIDVQFSYGVYAGVMCRECAIAGYRDQCGHRPEGQGRASELEALRETYFEEET